MWLKNQTKYSNYPRERLIENAELALEPDEETMEEFYRIFDRMASEGKMSFEEMQAIRIGLFRRAELMEQIDGDRNNINEESVLGIKNKLEEKYGQQNSAELANAQRQIESLEIKNQHIENNVYKAVGNVGKTTYHRIRKIGLIFIYILLAILLLSGITLLFIAYWTNDPAAYLAFVFTIILGIYTLIDLIKVQKRRFIFFVEKVAKNAADRQMDKKRREFSSIFEKD